MNKQGSNQYCVIVKYRKSRFLKAKLLLFVLIMYIFTFLWLEQQPTGILNPTVDASTSPVALLDVPAPSPSPVEVSPEREMVKDLETREEKVEYYLKKYNSPLAKYAEFIVKVSDENDISYTLIPSIAGKETSFGTAGEGPKFYNAWGIMTWDENGKRSQKKFSSWTESINYEAKLLSNHYRENMNRAIQEKYCPSFECSDTWVSHVTEFQKEINSL